ncbi:MAG TPA: DMP19 family protein [Pedobacter sp.]|nr:DMP19 family protein [Pedobacter sp.]
MNTYRLLITSLLAVFTSYLASCTGNIEANTSAVINTPVKSEPLTPEIIDQTSDDKLIELIYNDISSKIPTDPGQEYESVLSLTGAQQAIYINWGLEAEINNGGFNQYYYNSTGQFARLAPEALKLVGAHQLASLTQAANEMYEREKEKITKDQDGSIEGFSKSYENNSLEKFDEQFYKLKESLSDLQIAFIRKNKAAFTYK